MPQDCARSGVSTRSGPTTWWLCDTGQARNRPTSISSFLRKRNQSYNCPPPRMDSWRGGLDPHRYQCYRHGSGLRKARELKLRNVVTHLEMTGSTQASRTSQRKNVEGKVERGVQTVCPMGSRQRGAERGTQSQEGSPWVSERCRAAYVVTVRGNHLDP